MSLFLKQQSESESEYESEQEYTMLTLTIYYHIEFKNKDEAKKKCGLRWNSEKKQWYNKLEYKNVNDSINVDNIFDEMTKSNELKTKYLSYPITKIVCNDIKPDGIKKLEIILRQEYTKKFEASQHVLILEIGMKKRKYEFQYKNWYDKGNMWRREQTDDEPEYKELDNLPASIKTLILINDNFNIMMQHLPPALDTIYIKHSDFNNINYDSIIRLPYGCKIVYFKKYSEIPELNITATYPIYNVLM